MLPSEQARVQTYNLYCWSTLTFCSHITHTYEYGQQLTETGLTANFPYMSPSLQSASSSPVQVFSSHCGRTLFGQHPSSTPLQRNVICCYSSVNCNHLMGIRVWVENLIDDSEISFCTSLPNIWNSLPSS